MLRIDRSVTPTMAKTPDARRPGSSTSCAPSRTSYGSGTSGVSSAAGWSSTAATVGIADDAVVVHCAASGLQYPPLVPIWRPEAITLQPIRAGFPCFGAALAGYVEATRDDDAEKNRLCPPRRTATRSADWARMNVLGTRATMSFGAEPDIKAWADARGAQPGPGAGGLPAVARARRRARAAGGVHRPWDGAGGRAGGRSAAVTDL